VLERIAKVDPAKQAGLLTQLFGTESVSAIAPLLTNLDLLKSSFKAVGEGGGFAGSMQAEYTERSKTTANSMQLLTNKVTRLGAAVGDGLLPSFNSFMDQIGPAISQMSSLAAAHPGVIRGVLGAGVAFGVLRVAVMGAVVATKILSAVTAMSPIGLIVRGIALAAGLLIANWSTVAPYFEAIWEKIKGPAMVLWGWFKQAFAFSPIGLVIENWGPLTELFSSLWNVLVAVSTPVMDFLGRMFEWTPLGMIVKNWEPIAAWFGKLWEKLKPIIEPMMKYFGGGEGGEGIIKTATNKANEFAEEQRVRNAGPGGGDGAFVEAGAVEGAQRYQRMMNNAAGIPSTEKLLSRPSLANQSSGLLQQASGNQAPKLNGEITINIPGAPPGTTVDQAKTNQPGLSIKPSVGTRTIGVMRPNQ
jgi:hypothetical protein